MKPASVAELRSLHIARDVWDTLSGESFTHAMATISSVGILLAKRNGLSKADFLEGMAKCWDRSESRSD